jgi:membrane protease YdiL (CAAX protease family)
MTAITEGRPSARGAGWLGVVLALGGPAAMIALTHSGLVELSLFQRRAVTWVVLWALTLAVLAICRVGERRPLASLGLGRLTLGSLGFGLLAGVLAILAFPACAVALKLVGVDNQATVTAAGALAGLPLWARLATLVTAGFCEEVLYRGYPITRLQALTGSRLIAVILPMAVFVALHAPSWGVAHLLYVTVVAVIMTVLILWRGDLWSNVIAHIVTDAVPLLVMPLMMAQAGHSG